MFRINSYNRSSIIAGVITNLVISIMFIIFIILGHKNTAENAAIQDDTFKTNFQARLILKSINGLSQSRADLIMGMKNKSIENIETAEDHLLGAYSNYRMLLSEQVLNKGHVSLQFIFQFEEIRKIFDTVMDDENIFLEHSSTIEKIVNNSKKLIGEMYDEESTLWVNEALRRHTYSKIKERNLVIFYGVTILFFIIQIMFIYYTLLTYRLNKKINIQHERLVLQTRLSTLGMMSAELAHEINSPLMVIDGRLRILYNEFLINPSITDKMYKNVEIIRRNSKRIQGIIRSFKTMSKSGDQDNFEEIKLNTIFEEVKDLVVQKLTDENIEFEITNISSEYLIEARRIQVVQVLTNLINNSMDAIRHLDQPWIKIDVELIDDQIKIYITDSGHGIPEEHVDNIFDPFYSTKGSLEGTGLGLSISKKIMKEHGGDLVYNSNHQNTQFILTFKYKKAHSV